MLAEEKKNGKKIATIILGSIAIASILVVIIITAFYKMYDPTKYGRCNGGIDQCQEDQLDRDTITNYE